MSVPIHSGFHDLTSASSSLYYCARRASSAAEAGEGEGKPVYVCMC